MILRLYRRTNTVVVGGTTSVGDGVSMSFVLPRSFSGGARPTSNIAMKSNLSNVVSRPSSSRPRFSVPTYAGQSLPIPCAFISNVTNQIDLANIVRPSFDSQTPILLQNILGTCDAIHFWRSLEYWRHSVDEDQPVEVEIGKSYNSGNRSTISFGEYLNYLEASMQIEDREYKGIQEGGLQPDQDVAYLAQNELFPQVMQDIHIPSFCEDATFGVGDGKLYHTMLWMGPRHTVSPLHYDPLDNILMQIVGWKRVLLFQPDNYPSSRALQLQDGKCEDDVIGSVENNQSRIPARVAFMITSEQRHRLMTVLGYTSEDIRTLKPIDAHFLLEFSVKRNDPEDDYRVRLGLLMEKENDRLVSVSDTQDSNPWHYAGKNGNQYNTSAVDIENPDRSQFPNFFKAPVPYECVLGPGDALFIPKRWWHHVRSLEMSVSANVWWR